MVLFIVCTDRRMNVLIYTSTAYVGIILMSLSYFIVLSRIWMGA